MLENNEKISFKNTLLWTMQSIQIWKICLLVYMVYFIFWVFPNLILFTSYFIILYHDYLNERKKYFNISSADMLHIFTIQFHYFSNPAIFLAIFSFMLITCHIMASNSESHAIAIKFYFGVWQSRIHYFL